MKPSKVVFKINGYEYEYQDRETAEATARELGIPLADIYVADVGHYVTDDEDADGMADLSQQLKTDQS